MANMSSPNTAIACTKLGSSSDNITCCYPNDQSSPSCQQIFTNTPSLLKNGCPNNDCISDCKIPALLYTSLQQTDAIGSGDAPIARYQVCASMPSIVRSMRARDLDSTLTRMAGQYVRGDATEEDLINITSTVTDCLSSTCRNARRRDLCYDDYCSPAKLLANRSTPDIAGINSCMHQLCGMSFAALPYADADVLGVGVHASYVLQCMFIVILWFRLIFDAVANFRRTRQAPNTSKVPKPEDQKCSWVSLLIDFHKAQCYFTSTLMIASFTYGIYDDNVLISFMLIPLALNGVLPVVFAYLLIFYHKKVTVGITLLTAVSYVLSSIVYWTLYSHLSALSGPADQRLIYRQFMFKLSALPACGGYSALAACPKNLINDLKPVQSTARKIRVVTPVVWAGTTIIFLGLLGYQARLWNRRRREVASLPASERAEHETGSENAPVSRLWSIGFWIATIVMGLGMCIQLSLLDIGKILKLIDPDNWGFGQIVAVTIWIPPLLEYIYGKITGRVRRAKHRRQQDNEANEVEKPMLAPTNNTKPANGTGSHAA